MENVNANNQTGETAAASPIIQADGAGENGRSKHSRKTSSGSQRNARKGKPSSRKRNKATTLVGKNHPEGQNEAEPTKSEDAPADKDKKTKKSDRDDHTKSRTQKEQREAELYAHDVRTGIVDKQRGSYLRDENGDYHVLLPGYRVALNLDKNNYLLNALLLKGAHITLAAPVAKAVIYNLLEYARQSAGDFKLRYFSAMSKDRKRLYVPVAGPKGKTDISQLLQISAEGIQRVDNGSNADKIWLEHPEGNPFAYDPAKAKKGLELLESLIVNKLTVRSPEMAWFCVMQGVLFVFVRDQYNDRMILLFIGSTQSGKSSGARWESVLLGFDNLKSDYKCAAFDQAGDIGAFFFDNKEQHNLAGCMQDKLLALSTGGETGRGTPTGQLRRGSSTRPVGVITSIEGPTLTELRNRTVPVEFYLSVEQMSKFEPDKHKMLIEEHRDAILSGVVAVLQRFMQNDAEDTVDVSAVPNDVARVQSNYRANRRLLRAFAEVAEKPAGWAENIIRGWDSQMSSPAATVNEGLAYVVKQSLDEMAAGSGDVLDTTPKGLISRPVEVLNSIFFRQQAGKLYVTQTIALFEHMKQKNRNGTLGTWQALNARLSEVNSSDFMLLRESDEDVKANPQLDELLKRANNGRRIAFFVPNGSSGGK
ncbi:MAG TPA: hypothetical protein VL155_04745 [Terriglobales bacterium]|jgi:hypothetical protein|nr:hypothetical protein [Terriglobales bacterium]